jgi:hypothetical protein
LLKENGVGFSNCHLAEKKIGIGVGIGFSNCHLADKNEQNRNRVSAIANLLKKRKNRNRVSAIADLLKKNFGIEKVIDSERKKFPMPHTTKKYLK